jgi:hypothetical protein
MILCGVFIFVGFRAYRVQKFKLGETVKIWVTQMYSYLHIINISSENEKRGKVMRLF